MLTRSDLNVHLTQVIASGGNDRRLWMITNPGTGTMVFKVISRGETLCETLSLEKALGVYNE